MKSHVSVYAVHCHNMAFLSSVPARTLQCAEVSVVKHLRTSRRGILYLLESSLVPFSILSRFSLCSSRAFRLKMHDIVRYFE